MGHSLRKVPFWERGFPRSAEKHKPIDLSMLLRYLTNMLFNNSIIPLLNEHINKHTLHKFFCFFLCQLQLVNFFIFFLFPPFLETHIMLTSGPVGWGLPLIPTNPISMEHHGTLQVAACYFVQLNLDFSDSLPTVTNVDNYLGVRQTIHGSFHWWCWAGCGWLCFL